MGSAGAIVIDLLMYLLSMSMASGPAKYLYQPLFIVAMNVGGLVLTSMIFSDMHDADERYWYLMQPVSNFERMLSRYLISGPLFYVYFVALYYLLEIIARTFSNFFIGDAAQLFNIHNPIIQDASRLYLGAHALLLLGAVYFRSYALVKTILSLAGLGFACGLVFWLSMRIIFWEYFPSLGSFMPRNEPPTSFDPASWPAYIHWAIGITLYFWVLFIAYTTLQDHEA